MTVVTLSCEIAWSDQSVLLTRQYPNSGQVFGYGVSNGTPLLMASTLREGNTRCHATCRKVVLTISLTFCAEGHIFQLEPIQR